MWQRSVSAIGVVIVGLVPALLGGPIFAVVFTAIALLAFRELLPLVGLTNRNLALSGALLIVMAMVLAWSAPDSRYLALQMALTLLVPFAIALFTPTTISDRRDWPVMIGVTMYLVLPTFAAISLRGTEGEVDRAWFQSLANAMPGSDRTAEGLGLLVMAVLITWMSDTAAYLVGKSMGHTRLIPRISPNKTVEGAIGGLVAAAITAVVCVVAFGLAINPLAAVVFGIVAGAIGILGDLGESMIKRRAGAKDSGTLIPGHGGILDRIDALIFVLVTTWALLPLLT